MTKVTKKEFIKDLLAQGLSEDEILEKLAEGDKEKGISPAKPPFNKLIFRRVLKEL